MHFFSIGERDAERANGPQASAAGDFGRDGEADDQDRAGHHPGKRVKDIAQDEYNLDCNTFF